MQVEPYIVDIKKIIALRHNVHIKLYFKILLYSISLMTNFSFKINISYIPIKINY